MKTEDKSNCCHAPVKIEGGDENTMFYRCLECMKACDLCSDDDCHCIEPYPSPEHGDKCMKCGKEI